jgi:hypothetical protein
MIDLAVTLSAVALSGTKKSEDKTKFPLEYFTYKKGPLATNPNPLGSLDPHYYYKKSKKRGEREIVRLNQRPGINEENWIHADGLWFEIGIHETLVSTDIDHNAHQYLLSNLPRSTKTISYYHNHPDHPYEKVKPYLKRKDVVPSPECPAYNDVQSAQDRISEVKSRLFFTDVDYRIVTQTGIYILKLNQEYYRTKPYHYVQNMHKIEALIILKTDYPSALRSLLKLHRKADTVEENKAFCRYLNEHQQAWKFYFIPISP